MKRLTTTLLLMLLTVCFATKTYSQTETPPQTPSEEPSSEPETPDENIESKVDKLQKTLEDLKKIIESDSDKSTTVGEFKLIKLENVDVYFCNNGKCELATDKKAATKFLASFKVNIDNVIIDIYNGVISDIQVFTKENKTFTNGLAPIEVNKFDRCDLLKFFDGNNTYYIQTCDILDFKRNGNYYADDCRIELKEKDEKKTISKDVGINSVINLRVYSDLLGTFGGEENGLIQTEANFKTPLITSNVWNKPMFFLHNFSSNLRVSKFDDKFKYTPVKYTIGDTTITGSDTLITQPDTSFSRQMLNQRNWFNFDVNFNFFTAYFKNKSRSYFSLDILSGFALANFSNRTDTLIAVLPYIGLNPLIKIIPAPNIGITLMVPIIWQWAPQLDKYGYGKDKLIITPELELFWNPLKSPGSRLFTRVRYSTMVTEKNPFITWQLGYTLAISELINKKLENK